MKYSIMLAIQCGDGVKRTAVLESFRTKREATRGMSKWQHAWRRGQFHDHVGTKGRSGFTAVKGATLGFAEQCFIGNFRGVARARFTLMKEAQS